MIQDRGKALPVDTSLKGMNIVGEAVLDGAIYIYTRQCKVIGNFVSLLQCRALVKLLDGTQKFHKNKYGRVNSSRRGKSRGYRLMQLPGANGWPIGMRPPAGKSRRRRRWKGYASFPGLWQRHGSYRLKFERKFDRIRRFSGNFMIQDAENLWFWGQVSRQLRGPVTPFPVA